MIGFAGLSHLGIVTSVATASKGHRVCAFDPDSVLCRRLKAGDLPLLEPGLPELFAACQSRIWFTDDVAALKECGLIFFSMDVPTDKNNRSDLSSLHRLIDKVAARASQGTVLVVLSQVPPGFTRDLVDANKGIYGSQGLQVFYQAETLIFGCAVERALRPERFIVGCNNPDSALPPLYKEWLDTWDCPILPMRYESAELTKISINLYLAASIGVANTLSELCEVSGADWLEIVPALRLDRRIGPHAYLIPGLGIAGGNIERDLVAASILAGKNNVDPSILSALAVHSGQRRNWIVKALQRHVFPRYRNPRLAVWGLSYKPGTRSTKNSPSLTLLESFPELPMRVYDPQANLGNRCYSNVKEVPSALEACEGAHALIIMTAWEEFISIPPSKMRGLMSGHVVIDPVAAWDRSTANEAGFLYCTLGAPPSQPKESRMSGV